MKKSENKKFSLDKFEVAKLNNLKLIKGGDSSGICTTTDTGNDSSKACRKTVLTDSN